MNYVAHTQLVIVALSIGDRQYLNPLGLCERPAAGSWCADWLCAENEN